MSEIKIYKENWLLIVFISLFTLGLLGFYFLDTAELFYNSRSSETVPFFILLFAGIIIAPVIEELGFRGAFIKKNIFAVISLLIIVFYVAISYKNYFAVAVFILYLISYYIFKKNKSTVVFKLFCILNATLFGLVHYTMDDFTSIEKGFIILFQISIGFLLIWVTLNYNLTRSMIVHAIYNTLAFSFLIIGLQFPDNKINTYDNSSIEVKWQRVPLFNSTTTGYSSSSEFIDTKNTSVTKFFALSYFEEVDEDKKTIIPMEPYMKYNFSISLKKNIKSEELDELLVDFFIKEGLIAPVKTSD